MKLHCVLDLHVYVWSDIVGHGLLNKIYWGLNSIGGPCDPSAVNL